MRRMALCAPLLLVFIVAGCATEEEPRSPAPDPADDGPVGEDGVGGEIPPDLLQDVVRDASVETGVAEGDIDVVAINEMDWVDGTLGCPQAFEDPGDETVVDRGGSVGWQVFLDAEGQELDYRVAEHRFFILCEEAS